MTRYARAAAEMRDTIRYRIRRTTSLAALAEARESERTRSRSAIASETTRPTGSARPADYANHQEIDMSERARADESDYQTLDAAIDRRNNKQRRAETRRSPGSMTDEERERLQSTR